MVGITVIEVMAMVDTMVQGTRPDIIPKTRLLWLKQIFIQSAIVNCFGPVLPQPSTLQAWTKH